MNDVIFELKDVWFSYLGKFPALCGLDINMVHGEKIAVIGANGTGKSTLLSVLDGLIFPDKGIVKFSGEELNENSFYDENFSRNFRKRVGFVFQNPDVQLFCPTVREDILFGPLHLEMPEEKTEERFNELADFLDIKHLLDRSPHQLSVGEKRKVAIASTLIIDPEVIILDEPTAGLDPKTTRHIIDIIVKANEQGKTIITATHDLHVLDEISDAVYVFGNSKKIIKSGHVEELLGDRQFLEENNLIHIHAHRHQGKIHVHPHTHAKIY